MAQYIDQAGFPVSLPRVPERIISLVPSQTELLADLGLDERVVGITRFCVHPETWKSSRKTVGGTKKINLDAISQLQPDLIIANKEENEKDQVMALRENYPVWTSDIHNLEDALAMIESIGELTGTTEKARNLSDGIRTSFAVLPPPEETISAAYLIWQKPYMTVGHDTFIHAMLQRAGFRNVYADKTRYPETSLEEIAALNPAVLLLSSEPFPFREKHANALSALLPGVKCLVVDGEMFSWYGSRLLYAADYFRQLAQRLSGR